MEGSQLKRDYYQRLFDCLSGWETIFLLEKRLLLARGKPASEKKSVVIVLLDETQKRW